MLDNRHEARALFPITERAIYFNHAAVSPPPLPTLRAFEAQLRDVHENGSVNFRCWLAVKERARELLAKLLGAKADRLLLCATRPTRCRPWPTELTGAPATTSSRSDTSFPPNLYPWLRIRDVFGVEVRMCEEREGRIDLAELESLVDDNTRVVAVSHVQFASGFRIDLERLGRVARRHDALFVVDAIQALGVIPTNVEAELIDVAAGAAHKWLLGSGGCRLPLSFRPRA